jgi:DNA-binding response OmpR family regulator
MTNDDSAGGDDGGEAGDGDGDGGGRPTVLAVDDEETITEAYALWLADGYDVRTAGSGREALDAMDETVDVVLLDRRMPDTSGDEVLAAIRERGYDCRVALVTAIDPDFDVADMAFDCYLQKPVDGDELRETVERLLALSAYEADSRELLSLVERRAVLETEKSPTELEESEEYARLTAAIERKKADTDGMEFDDATFASALEHLTDDPA